MAEDIFVRRVEHFLFAESKFRSMRFACRKPLLMLYKCTLGAEKEGRDAGTDGISKVPVRD